MTDRDEEYRRFRRDDDRLRRRGDGL